MRIFIAVVVFFAVILSAKNNEQLYLSKTRIATFSPILSDDRVTPFFFSSPIYYVDAYEDGKPTDYLYSKQPHMGVHEPFGGNPSGKVDFTFKNNDEYSRYFKLETKHVGDFFFLKISYSYNADFNTLKNSELKFEVEALFTSTSNSNSNFVQLRNKTQVIINVRDLNNNCPTFRPPSFTFNIREDISTLTSIGKLTAKDLDDGFNSQIFFVLVSKDSVPFYLNPYSGKLFATKSLILPKNRNQSVYSTVFPPIYVNKARYELQAKVVHRGLSLIDCGNIQLANIVINIIPVNHHAPMISITNSDDDSIATVKVYDPSEGTKIHLSILPFSMNTYFELQPILSKHDPNAQSYNLKMKRLDHLISAKLKVSLQLNAVDHADTLRRSLTAREHLLDDLISIKSIKKIDLNLVDDKSVKYYTDSGLYFEISERTRVNSLIGIVRGRQNLPINNYISLFSDLSPTWNGYVNLTQSGALYLTKQIDLERDSNNEILIKFGLGNKNNIVLSSLMKDVIQIRIKDYNDFPPLIKNNGSLFHIKENTNRGHVVFDVEAVDPDFSNTQLTYVLLNANDLPFQFDSIDRKSIIVKSPLDAETMPRSFKVHVEVIDSGHPYPMSSLGIFTVEIDDVDEYKAEFLYNSCNLEIGVNNNGLVALDTDTSIIQDDEVMDLGNYSPQDIDRDGSKFINTLIKSTNIARPCFKMTNSLILTCNNLSPPGSTITVILESSSSSQKIDDDENKNRKNIEININLVRSDKFHFIKNCKKSMALEMLEANDRLKNELRNRLDKNAQNLQSLLRRHQAQRMLVNMNSPKFDHEAKVYLNIPENLPIGTRIFTINGIDMDSGEFSANGLLQFTINNIKLMYVDSQTDILMSNGLLSNEIIVPFLLSQMNDDHHIENNSNNKSSVVITTLGTVDLVIGESIDRDTIANAEVEVQVCDMPNHDTDVKCDQITFVIAVLDLNDELPIVTSSGHQLTQASSPLHEHEGIMFAYENMTIHSMIGQVNASDRDIFSSIRYSLVNYREIFHIDEMTGKIILINKLDREERDHYDLNILITDVGYHQHTKVDERLLKLSQLSQLNKQTTNLLLRIQVLDSDDSPIVFDPIKDLAIPSDLPNGAHVVTVHATVNDIGINEYIKYFLINNHGNCFSCDSNTGVIIVSNSCQGLKENHAYNLSVNAFNPASNHQGVQISFNVRILPVVLNNFPPKFSQDSGLYLAMVMENSPPGTIPQLINTELFNAIGPLKIQAMDPDQQANISYSIVAGSGLGKFTINQDGLIRTSVALDAETTSYVRGYWLTIIAKEILSDAYEHQVYSQDDEKSIAFAEVFIKVLDLNDHHVMTDRPVYVVTIPENTQPHTFISTPVIVDKNRDGKSFQFEIIHGNENSWFTIDPEFGLIKSSTNTINRENMTSASSSVHLVVRASEKVDVNVDNKQVPIDSIIYHVRVIISDINDNQPEFFNANHQTKSISLSFYPSQDTKCVGRVFALDLDAGDNGTVVYSQSESSILTLDKRSGAICLNPQANEQQRYNNYTLQVFAKDLAGQTSETFRLSVNLLRPVTERSEIHFEKPQSSNIQYVSKGRHLDAGTVIHNFAVITRPESLSVVVCYFDDDFSGPLMVLPEGVHITPNGMKSNHFGIMIVDKGPLPGQMNVFMICTDGHSTSIHQNLTISNKNGQIEDSKIAIDMDRTIHETDWLLNESGISSRLLWKNHNAHLELKIPENTRTSRNLHRIRLVNSLGDELSIIVKRFDSIPGLNFRLENNQHLIVDRESSLDFEDTPELNYLVIIGSNQSLVNYPNTVNLESLAFLSVNVQIQAINEYQPKFHCYNVINTASKSTPAGHDYCYTFSIPFNAMSGSFIGQIAASDMDKTLKFSNYLLTGILPIRYNLSSSYPYFRIDKVTGEIFTTVTFSKIPLEQYIFKFLVTSHDIDHPDNERASSVFVQVQLSPGPGAILPTRLNGFRQSQVYTKLHENAKPMTLVVGLRDYLLESNLLMEKFDLINSTSTALSLNENTGDVRLIKALDNYDDIILHVELDQNLQFDLITKKIIRVIVKVIPTTKGEYSEASFIPSRLYGMIKENSLLGSPVLDMSGRPLTLPTMSDSLLTGVNYEIFHPNSRAKSIPFSVNQMSGVFFLNETVDYEKIAMYQFYIQIMKQSTKSLIEVFINVGNVNDTRPDFTDDANYICTLSLPTHAGVKVCQVNADVKAGPITYSMKGKALEHDWLHLNPRSGLLKVVDATRINRKSFNDSPRVFNLMIEAKNPFGYTTQAKITVHLTSSSQFNENRIKLDLTNLQNITGRDLLLNPKRISIVDYPEGSVNKFYLLKQSNYITIDPFKGIITLNREESIPLDFMVIPILIKNLQGFWIQTDVEIKDLDQIQLNLEGGRELEPMFHYLCIGNNSKCHQTVSLQMDQTSFFYEISEVFPRSWLSYFSIDEKLGIITFSGNQHSNIHFPGKVAYIVVKMTKNDVQFKRTVFISWIDGKSKVNFKQPLLIIEPEKLENFHDLKSYLNQTSNSKGSIIFNILPSVLISSQSGFVATLKEYLTSLKTYFLVPNFIILPNDNGAKSRRKVVFNVGAKTGLLSAHIEAKIHQDLMQMSDSQNSNNFVFLIEAIDLSTGIKSVNFVYIKNLPIQRSPPYFQQSFVELSIHENTIPSEPILKVNAFGDVENLTYSIASSTIDDHFLVNKDDGNLLLVKHLDRENQTVHFVKVAGQGLLSGTVNHTFVKINVIDKNDNPPYFNEINCPMDLVVSIKMTSSSLNRTITQFTALDDDSSPQLNYHIIPNDEYALEYLTIFHLDQASGQLVLLRENIRLFKTFPEILTYRIVADDGLHSSQSCSVNMKLVDQQLVYLDNDFGLSSHRFIEFQNNVQNAMVVKLDNKNGSRVHSVRLLEKSKYFNGTLTNCIDPESYIIDESTNILRLSQDFDPTSCRLVEMTLVRDQIYQEFQLSFIHAKPNILPRFLNKDYTFTLYPDQYSLGDSQIKPLPIYLHLENYDPEFFFLKIEDTHQTFGIDQDTKQLLLTSSIQGPTRDQEGSIGFQLRVNVCQRIEPIECLKTLDGSTVITILFAANNRFKHDYFPKIICSVLKLQRVLSNLKGDTIGKCQLDNNSINDPKISIWSMRGPSDGILSIDPDSGEIIQHQGLPSLVKPMSVVIHYRTIEDDDNKLSFQCFTEVSINYEIANLFPPKFTRPIYPIDLVELPRERQFITKVSAYDLDYNLNDPIVYWSNDSIVEVEQSGRIFIRNPYTIADKLANSTSEPYKIMVSCNDSSNQIASTIVELNYSGKIRDSLNWINDNESSDTIAIHENDILPENHGIIYDFGKKIPIDSSSSGLHLNFFIITSNSTNELVINERTGQLMIVKPFDAEYYSGRSVTLQVVASNGRVNTKTPYELVINILDVNDNSPICQKKNVEIEIAENIPANTKILEVSASDLDVSEEFSKLTYKFTTNDVANIVIDPDSGHLMTEGSLPNNTWSILLIVRVSDVDGNSCHVNVTITVIDVNNEPPVFDTIEISPVKEDASVGNIIGYVHATDPDKDDQHQLSYEIENSTESRFSIHQKTGIISINRPLDRETQANHTLNIIVRDSPTNQHTTSTSLTIILLDVNDSPPEFINPNPTVRVPESLEIGSIITRVEAVSLDEGVNALIKYRLFTNQSEIQLNTTTGEIRLVKALDYERSREYFLTIEASDSGLQPNRRSTVVTITVLDENDNSPQFHQRKSLPFNDTIDYIKSIKNENMLSDNNCYDFKVYEGSKISTLIGKIDATDLDSKELTNLTYEFVDAPPSWLLDDTPFLTSRKSVPFMTSAKAGETFSINQATGEIKLKIEPDRETTPEYWFVVKVSDNGKPNEQSNTTCVRLSILDVNDEPPRFKSDSFEFLLEVDREGNITAVQDENGEMIKVTNFSSKVLLGRLHVKDLDDIPNSGPFSCSLVSQSHANTYANSINQYEYHSRIRQSHKTQGQGSSFLVQSDNSQDQASDGHCSIYSINQLNVGTHTLTIRVNDNGLTSMNSKAHVKIRVLRQTNVPPELIPTNATIILFNHKNLLLNAMENRHSILSEPLAKIHVIDESLYKNKLKFEIIPKTQHSDLFMIDEVSGKIRLAHTIIPAIPSSRTIETSHTFDKTVEVIDDFKLPKINATDMTNYQSVLNKLNSGSYPLLVRVTNGTLSSEDYINIEVISITDEMLENAVVMRISSFIPNSFFVDKYDEVVKRRIASAIGDDISWYNHVRFLSVQPASQLDSNQPSPVYRRRRNVDKDAIDILLSVYRPKNREYMRAYQLEEKIRTFSKDLGKELNAEITVDLDVCHGKDCKRGDCISKIVLSSKSDVSDENYNRVEVVKVNQLFPKFNLVSFCECPINYGGPNCDQPVNECANAACPAPKVCVPIGMQGFTCVCPPPKSGPNCESSLLLKSHSSQDICDTEDCFSQREFGSLRFNGNSYIYWRLLDAREKSFELSFKVQTKMKNSSLLVINWDSMRKLFFEINPTGQLEIKPSYLNATRPLNGQTPWFTSKLNVADGEEHKISFQFTSLKDLDSDQLLAEALLKASQSSQINYEDDSEDRILSQLADVNKSLINYFWSYQLSIDSLIVGTEYLTWTPIDSKIASVFIGGLPSQSLLPESPDLIMTSISYERISLIKSFTGCLREILINDVKPPYQPHISPQQSIMLTMNTKRSSRILVEHSDRSPFNNGFEQMNRISLINLNNIDYGICDKKWLTACSLADCQNGSECRLHDESDIQPKARCNCSPGFYDAKCTKISNSCLRNPCQNGGICQRIENESILNSNYICRCKENFTGANCELPILEDINTKKKITIDQIHKSCDLLAKLYNSPKQGFCLNGGICETTDYGALCLCPEGWKGTRCEVDINECDIVYQRLKRSHSLYLSPSSTRYQDTKDLSYDLCSWHGNSRGSCSNLDGSFSCNCSLGYTGRFCQVKNLASLNPDPNPFGLSQIQVYIIISLLAVLFIGALVTILIITFKLCPCLGYDDRNRYNLNPNRWFKMKMNSLIFKRKKDNQPFIEPGYHSNGINTAYHPHLMHPSGSMMKLGGGTMTPSIAGSQLHLASYSQLPTVGPTPHTIGVNQSRFMLSPQGTGHISKKRPSLMMNPQMKNSQNSIMAMSVNGGAPPGYQVYMQAPGPNTSNNHHRPASTIDYRLDGGFENKSETASISSKNLIYNGTHHRPESSMGMPMLVMQNSTSNHHMFANSPTGSSLALHGAPPGAKIVFMPQNGHYATGHSSGIHPVESSHHIDRLSMGSGSDRISNQGSQSCAIRRSIIQNGQVYYHHQHPGSTQPTPLINNNRQSIYSASPQYILTTDATTGATVAMPVIVSSGQFVGHHQLSGSRAFMNHHQPSVEVMENGENFDHDTIRPLHRGSNFYTTNSGVAGQHSRRYYQNLSGSYRRPSSVALFTSPEDGQLLHRCDNQTGSQYSLSTDLPLANEVENHRSKQYLPQMNVTGHNNSQWDLRRSRRLSMNRNSIHKTGDNDPYSLADSQPLIQKSNTDSFPQADVSINGHTSTSSAFNMHTNSYTNGESQKSQNSNDSDHTENCPSVNETPKVIKKHPESQDFDGTLRAKV